MMFNLLSQKAFNPFHTVIPLILVPKWHHLEEKSALSPTNTIKLNTGSCPLLFESHHYKHAAHHLHQCIAIVVRTVKPARQLSASLWGHAHTNFSAAWRNPPAALPIISVASLCCLPLQCHLTSFIGQVHTPGVIHCNTNNTILHLANDQMMHCDNLPKL